MLLKHIRSWLGCLLERVRRDWEIVRGRKSKEGEKSYIINGKRKNRWKISPTKENVIYFYQIFTYHFISFNFLFFSSLFTVDKNVVFSRFVFMLFVVVIILWSWKIINPVFPFFIFIVMSWVYVFFCCCCLLLCKITAMIKARS